jgi:hypothetical protein
VTMQTKAPKLMFFIETSLNRLIRHIWPVLIVKGATSVARLPSVNATSHALGVS